MHCKSSIGRFSEFTLSRAFDEESVELSTGDRATARLDQGDGCPVNFGYVGNQHRTDFDRSEAQQIGGQVFSAFKGSIAGISCPPPPCRDSRLLQTRCQDRMPSIVQVGGQPRAAQASLTCSLTNIGDGATSWTSAADRGGPDCVGRQQSRVCCRRQSRSPTRYLRS